MCRKKQKGEKSEIVKLASETRQVAKLSLIYISFLELLQGAGKLKILVGGRITKRVALVSSAHTYCFSTLY